MVVCDVLESLRSLTGPLRKVDVAIAVEVGYVARQSVEGDGTALESWFDPNGKRVKRVPSFTERINAAISLSKLVKPDCVGAVAWSEEGARAQIDDGPIVFGPNVPIAVCIAVFEHLKAQSSG